MNITFVGSFGAASSAALAFGVAACGGDDSGERRRQRRRRRRRKTADGLLLAAAAGRVAPADRRPWSTASSSRSSRRGGKAGDFTVKYKSLDDSTAQAGTWTPEADSANARKAAQDDSTAVYIGEFNSGALGGLDPDPQRGGRPAGQPGEHGRRPHHRRAGRRAGRAGQVLPERRAHLRPHRPEGHDPGRRAGDAHEGGRLHQGADPRTTRRSTARACRENIENSAKEQGLTIASNEAIDKNAANYRSLASKAKGAGADCMVYSRHHRQQRGADLQGLRGGAAGREALRP